MTDQYGQFHVRHLDDLPHPRFAVLVRIIGHCSEGMNFKRHEWTFRLSDFARELGWETDATPESEKKAGRVRLRRWLRDFEVDGEIAVVIVGKGPAAYLTVTLTGALVGNHDVAFLSQSAEPPMLRSVEAANAVAEPVSAPPAEAACDDSAGSQSDDDVTIEGADVPFGLRAIPYGYSDCGDGHDDQCLDSLEVDLLLQPKAHVGKGCSKQDSEVKTGEALAVEREGLPAEGLQLARAARDLQIARAERTEIASTASDIRESRQAAWEAKAIAETERALQLALAEETHL